MVTDYSKEFAELEQRLVPEEGADALTGRVVWAPLKSIWVSGHYLIAIIGGYLTFDLVNVLMFLGVTAFTLCLGHSLGMHRLFIHRSFLTYRWLEYFLVHLGVLVGLAGPKGMMQTHDMRDWAQRQSRCHDYFGHRQPPLTDAWWQMHCDIQLNHPPLFAADQIFEENPVLQWMEKYWMWQQLPWAVLLFSLGGIDWVIWGISARIAVSVTGHWAIGYLAHNRGHQEWIVKDAAVQGFNIPLASLLTMGESWHNNHHAFPRSARLGIHRGQWDPGWWVLKLLGALGFAWDIKQPQDLNDRKRLDYVPAHNTVSGNLSIQPENKATYE